MEFESFINHIEGVRDQFSGNIAVSKLYKSRRQESINFRYLCESRIAVRSGGSWVIGFIEYGGLVSRILLNRKLKVIWRSASIIFTLQSVRASEVDFRSVGVPLQFVLVSW